MKKIKQKIKQILIVEDDETNIYLYKYGINKFNLTNNLVIRENGKEALTYLEEQSKKGIAYLPSLILLDIEMPIMDGVEFLEHYRKLPERVQISRIIVASTSLKVQQNNFDQVYNVEKVISKPISKKDWEYIRGIE